jgi:hypothetical protein
MWVFKFTGWLMGWLLHTFKEIKLLSERFSGYGLRSPGLLDNLNHINILIGPNNSGKSRFLRRLFAEENLEFKLLNYDIDPIKKVIADGTQEIRTTFDKLSIQEADHIYQKLSGFK